MNDLNKTREELMNVVEEQKQEIESLKALQKTLITENNRVSYLLYERTKEIRCQNQISEILKIHRLSVDDVCQSIVNIIPPAWQFPEHTAASITVFDKVYVSPGFKKTAHYLTEQVKLGTAVIGSIEVYYTGEEAVSTNEVFLPEESDLLLTIALRVGAFFEIHSFYKTKNENDNQLKIITESSLDAIILIDNEGHISFWNPAAEKLLGYSKQEVLGHNLHQIIAPEKYHSKHQEAFERFRQTGEGPVINNVLELEAIRKDKTKIDIELSISRIKVDNKWNALGFMRDITQRKQAENLLRDNEKKYRNLIENINDVIYEIDINGTIRYISSPIERIINFKPEEIIGRNFIEFVGTNAEYLASRLALLKEKPEIFNEYKIKTKLGEDRWIRLSTKAIFSEDKLTGAYGTLIDITEKKQLDIELQKSEALYRSILQASPDTIFISDLSGNVLFTSPMANKMFGFSDLGFPIGESLFRFVSPSDHDKAREAIRLMKTGDYTGAAEYVGVKSDGSTFDMEVNGEFIRDPEGNPVSMVFVVRDITDRKRTEEKLRKSEESYRHLVENINDVVYEVGVDGTVKYVSPSIEKLLGFKPEELIGQSFISRLHDEDRETIIHRLKTLDERDYSFLEYRYYTKSNEIKWVRSSTNPIFENGKMVGGLGVLIDITDRKLTEQQLQKNEHKYRTLFVDSPDAYLLIQDGKFIDCNISSEKFLGGTRADIIGKTPEDISPEYQPGGRKSSELVPELIEKTLEEGQISFEWVHKRVDGTEFLAQINMTVIDYEGNRVLFSTWKDITAQRQAEEKLQESEARYKSFFESVNSIMLLIDPATNAIIDANPAACKFYGWTRNELCNMKVTEINTLSPKEVNDALQLSKESKRQYFEFKHRLSNGEIRHVEIYSGPVKYANQTLVHAIVHDITERKHIEEKLKESEARFRMVFENVFDGISIFEENDDPGKRRLIDCNEQYATMAGRSRQELLDIGFTYALTQSIEANANELRLKGLSGQSAYHGSFKWVRPDGKDNTIEYIARPIKFQGKSYSIGIDRDITEAKQIEDQLRRLSQAVEQSPVSIVITDLDGKIEYANPQACKTTGYSLDELKGENPRVLKSGETSNAEYQKLWSNISKGKYWKGIFHNKRKNGDLYWESSQISPIVDNNGNIINYLAVKEDITEQKRIQEELLERESELNQAQEMARMGSWTLNLKTNQMSWSENYYRLLGLEPFQEDVPSDYFFKMLYPEDAHLIDTMLEDMHNNRQQVSYDTRIITGNNEVKWMQNNIVPVFENNNLTILKGVIIDITDKKIADEKIRYQNEKLNAILRAIPDLIFINDKDGNYIEYFASHQEKLLVGPDQIIGKNMRDIFTEEQASFYIGKINLAINLNETITFDYSVHLPNSDSTNFEARIVPFSNDKVLILVRDMTEKARKDEEIKRLSMAVEQSPVSIVITNLNGEIEYVNPSFEQTTGYSTAEVIGKSTNILKSGQTTPETYQNMWETIEKGNEWHGVWINKKKNGELFWENISINPIHDSEGKIINYLAVKQDISEQKRVEQEILELNSSLEERIKRRTAELAKANSSLLQEIEVRKTTEAALAQSEKSYRLVVENVAEVIFQTDINGNWVFLNNSWETITGFSVKESLGELFINYVYPEDRERNWSEFEPLIQRKKEYCRHEIRYITKVGSYRWIEVYAKLGLDENNTIIGTYGTLQDVTDRKRAEEVITIQKDRLESIIEGSSLGTWEWNVQTGETIFNDKWAQLIGYTLDELAPVNIETWIKFVHPDDLQRSDKLLQQHFKGESDFYVCEARMKHKDGSWVWVQDSGKVISWTEDGKPLWMFGSHHDITERKRAEAFENEMLQLSPKLTGISLTEIESAINLALSRIGQVLDADRAYIFEFNPDLVFITNTYEWCNENISSQIAGLHNVPTSLFPALMKKLKKLEPVVIESVKDLPDSWKNEREILEPQDIKSLIMIPMTVENNLIGFVGLDSLKEKRTYTLTEINILKIWSSMLSSLIYNQRSERLLEQTRQNYETFFNTIDDFLFIFNDEGVIVDINQTVVNRLGYQHHELLQQPVTFVRPVDRRDEALNVMDEVLSGRLSSCTIPLLTSYGEQIPVETKIKRGYWNGNPAIFGISKDISQIKLSEEKFAAAFQSSSAMMAISNFDTGEFIDVNQAFIDASGYEKNELIGKTIKEFGILPDENVREFAVNKINSGEAIRELESIYITKNNEVKTGLLSSNSIYIGDQRCLLTVTVDITDRKKAEEQLSWNKSLLEMMSNSSPLGFLVVDNRTDEILYFNRRFCQIWGIEYLEEQMYRGELRNNDIIPYCIPVLIDVESFAESCKPLQDENNRIIVSDEIRFTNNRIIHRYSTQIRGADDRYYGRFYIFEDITEEKKAEEELRIARNEAEKANIAKSEFLSRMSHELRTPMNSILGFAQLLEMGELNAGQRKGVNHIMKSGRHLLDLINEVLDISRIESGRLSLSLEPVQLSSLVPEMTDVIKPQTIERQIKVHIIESPDNYLFVKSDRQRIKQILLNLLNNAIKYNIEGGSIFINIQLKQNQMVRISITDTGQGIAPEYLPKLFTPFERIGADKTNTEGTGLGLSVVKKLIEAMGGHYGVESIVNEGSTFWIELPLSESQLEKAAKSGGLNPTPNKIAGKSGTILYIEDNQSNVELVEQIIKNQRADIELITNSYGKKTVPLAIQHNPDLILLDLNLPDIHGSSVLQQLKLIEETRNIPVVIISADAMPHQLEKLREAGAKNYLTKPLDIPEFLNLIKEYLPGHD